MFPLHRHAGTKDSMFLQSFRNPKSCAPHRPRRAVARIGTALVASLALALSGCGGGDPYAAEPLPVFFNIGVTVGNQYVSSTPVQAGGALSVVIRAGQQLRLDAGEPVVWTFYVGGSAINGGAQVYYAGADITAYRVSASAMGLDTFAYYPLPAPVAVTFVARSVYDSVQVATVRLLITN